MSNFTAKMHQIRFRLGLRQDPAGGAFSALQKSYLDLKGPTSNGGREKGRGARWSTEGKGVTEERGGKGKGGQGFEIWHPH